MEVRKLFIKFSLLDWFYMNVIRPLGYLICIYPGEYIKILLIKLGVIKKYRYLEKYKDINKGKRCFIIGTGPSLTIEDYNLLKDEITFGVNALCLWFEKNYITNYFFISDKYAYEKLKDKIPDKTFMSSYVNKKTNFKNPKLQEINVCRYNFFMNYCPKISKDISICSYDFNSVVFMAIQFAIYTGIKEIYLLGIDCNYTDRKVYAVDHGIRHRQKYMEDAGKQMIQNFIKLRVFCEKNNIKIYNASRGGKLDVFERVNLDELLERK